MPDAPAPPADSITSAPPDLRRLLAEVGPKWAGSPATYSDLVKAAYLPLQLQASRGHAAITRDVAYGAHPRQRLDIFSPKYNQGAAPVVLFVHGGAFVRGDKTVSAGMYDNVLLWFARHGYLGINIEYRLAPEAPYPGGAEDIAAAIDWVHANCAEYGGDAGRLFLIGHSAGGTHAASYAYDPALPWLGKHLRGLALISARLRADDLAENPNAAGVRAYFGTDAALYDRRSPVNYAAASSLPVFIACAEYENPLLDLYSLELAHRIALTKRRAPPFMRLAHHNHISMMAHFDTGEEVLGRALLDFFQTST